MAESRHYKELLQLLNEFEVEYLIVGGFDGEEIRKQCDYAVKLNPEQIILPEGIRAFPPANPVPLPTTTSG